MKNAIRHKSRRLRRHIDTLYGVITENINSTPVGEARRKRDSILAQIAVQLTIEHNKLIRKKVRP